MREGCSISYERSVQLDSEEIPGGFVRYYADGDEEIIHANGYVIKLFECDSVEEFLELTQGSFKHFVYEDDLGSVESSIKGQVRNRNNPDHVYYRIRTKTGRIVTVMDYGRLQTDSPYQRPIFEVFIARVSSESAIDWLTGLSGMARFLSNARTSANALTESGQRTVAIAFDIIGMKSFNTRYGREEGDRLLCALADALSAQFGREACSRFGEDHFYAFTPEEGAAKKVSAVFSAFAISDFDRVPPVRAGLYLTDKEDDIVAIGFDRARTACDLDRTTWQSHLTWYTDNMRSNAQLRNYVLEHLDQAIAEKWIRAYYQPVMRSTTGKICEEEALARWVDPTYGVLPPNVFIPVLEEASLSHRLDLHIVSCVVEDFKWKREQGIPIAPVSVNISYRDLVRLNVAHEIASRTDEAGIPHDLLHVEFTESAIHSDPDLFRQQVKDLHDAGFEVWMDDFGSGYSSLNVLQRYEFDVIKLDMEFLRGDERDLEKGRAIVAGIVRTTKQLGLRSVAEGVETEAQATFLEGIGCDMLQGYLFSSPQPLDVIAQRFHDGVGLPREERDEEGYWNQVCNLSLTDFSQYEDGQGIEGIAISEFPAGVLEHRDGQWYVIRDNRSMYDFLKRTNIVDEDHSELLVNPIPNGLDEEFVMASTRSKESGKWEQIASRLEYGSGFQFYVKPLSSTDKADAYTVVGVPTMLGTALGSYGDVPVGYAVFRVILNETGDEVVDTVYVYANGLYRDWAGFGDRDPTGLSFLATVPNADTLWFPYCYRAAVLGEELHDTVYSPETGHWMNFHIAPCPITNCCVYAFSLADAEHYERQELKIGLDTSGLIIELANALNGEVSYSVAMNHLLEAMSTIIHPDRLYVFEIGEETVSNTFEWCAEGIEPQIDTLQDLDPSEFDTWEELLTKEPVVVIPDVEEFKESDPRMYWQLTRQGITHLLAVPFYDGDRLLGYLGADNYMLEEDLDSIRVLQTVSSFISARIVNHRLMDVVERLATRDELTGLLNRKGVDLAVEDRLSQASDEPYALALMDIDAFKDANVAYGRELGDIALGKIAEKIVHTLPEGAIFGRNGGDEFAIALFGEDARLMESCLTELVDAQFACEHAGARHVYTLSAGYACSPEQVKNLHDAYSKADSALRSLRIDKTRGCRKYEPGKDRDLES